MSKIPPLPQCRPFTAVDGFNRGWRFVPLRGKQPIRKRWQEGQHTIDDLNSWLSHGNVGVVTGSVSGVVVIDQDDGGSVVSLDLPETVTAETGSGNRHYYFAYTGNDIGNSASKLAPKIDVRGNGGQAVFPGSTHPETGQPYRWIKSPRNTPIAPLPEHVAALLRPSPKKYIDRAMTLATQAVETAPNGTRNAELNKAAYSLGGLVASGHLDQSTVEQRLADAGRAAGLIPEEIRATIRSGMDSGKNKPRDIPVRSSGLRLPTRHTTEDESVLIPGPHVTDHGEYHEISSADFARSAINALPDDILYRRDHVPGELLGAQGKRYWAPMSDNRMVLCIDHNVRLAKWVKLRAPKEGGPEHAMVYTPCTKQFAALAIAHAQGSPYVRELRVITSYPIYGPGFVRSKPGYFNGTYYDEPIELQGIESITDQEMIHNIMEDLVVDFPFQSEADRQNFYGLMLTPIIAPALDGNRPLHMLISPLERTGKTKLAEEVFGGVILGAQTPAMQLTDRDEERDKRVLGILMQGGTLLHLDNLPRKIDSASLASLLTATNYAGRILGGNNIVNLQNNLTIVASGNNIQVTGEIAKRTIPICLQPASAAPESRQKFNHPDIREYVRTNRKNVLACLIGMVENWLDAGRPGPDKILGGFESWSRAVGGILQLNGMSEWRKNEKEWRSNASPHDMEMEIFVAEWVKKYCYDEVTLVELRSIAEQYGLFTELLNARNERAAQTSFGILLRNAHRLPVGGLIVNSRRAAEGKRYFLSEH